MSLIFCFHRLICSFAFHFNKHFLLYSFSCVFVNILRKGNFSDSKPSPTCDESPVWWKSIKFLEYFALSHFISTNIFYLTHFDVFFVNILKKVLFLSFQTFTNVRCAIMAIIIIYMRWMEGL